MYREFKVVIIVWQMKCVNGYHNNWDYNNFLDHVVKIVKYFVWNQKICIYLFVRLFKLYLF